MSGASSRRRGIMAGNPIISSGGSPTISHVSSTYGTSSSAMQYTVPASTFSAGDIALFIAVSEDSHWNGANFPSTITFTDLVSGMHAVDEMCDIHYSPVLTSAQATALNGYTIGTTNPSPSDSWQMHMMKVQGAVATIDPAENWGNGTPVSAITPSAPNRLALAFIDIEYDDTPASAPTLPSGWSTVLSGNQNTGDTGAAFALYSRILSTALGTQAITYDTGNGFEGIMWAVWGFESV